MKRCTRCVMPETWTGITFDDDNICNICRANETKQEKVDWIERQKEVKEIVKRYKTLAKDSGNKYECIIPFSGGKDSAYTLWASVVKYGLTPLVVTFDHGFPLSPEAEWNLMEIPKQLDCDHLRFTIGNGLRNALCFKASEVMGDFCWHCHNGVGAFPARISKQWDIPLQIWGEPTMAEYQTTGPYKYEELEEQTKEHFEKAFRAGVTPEMVLPSDYKMADLAPMNWPEGKFHLKALYLGCYEPWNQREQVEIITREMGWKHHSVEGTYVDWDKIDCPFEPVRDWQKFIKRGFGRTTFQASKDIRQGLLGREKALQMVEELDGKRPSGLDIFLKEVGMTEEAFNRITGKHIVSISE